MYVTMWGNDMLINLTVGIISHTHIYIYVERDYKIMLYTLNICSAVCQLYLNKTGRKKNWQ